MKLSIRFLSLILLLGLILFGCSGPGKKNQDKLRELTVDSLSVADIPGDGGDGLIISWKPLPKDKRIQEYRIYRGVHPDTLFFLATVQVNVKTGVASDMMYYYDSGYSNFIDLDSPGKLKSEKQNKGSIIYRAVPRDTRIAARLSENFSLYSQMADKDYYYHSKKARSADKTDEKVYAGMKFRQQTILASLKSSVPDQNPTYYYYTVVPVNERNKYLGIAKPVKGFPVDDRPEKSPGLYCVALPDAKKLQFEWDYPLNNSDLAAYSIYMLPAMEDAAWQAMDDATQQQILQAAGVPITQGPVGGGALKNYCVISEADLAASPAKPSWDNALASRFVIMFQDYGYPQPSPLSNLCQPVLKTSAQLPQQAKYKVEDKPMDKGDRLTVTWDNPIVFVTKTTSLNQKGTKLKINYQINKTDPQRINNVYFEFFEPGAKTPFAKVNEFYTDNIIKIRVPDKYSARNMGSLANAKKDASDSLKVRITIAVKPYKLNPENGRLTWGKAELVKNYETIQYLKPDPMMMAYMPTKMLLRNGVDVSTFQNAVFRKSYRGSAFSLVKRTTAYENNLDVNVGYVTTMGQVVAGFNFTSGDTLWTYMDGKRFSRKLEEGEKAQNLTLVPSEIDLTFDKESKTLLSTSIYADEARKKLGELKEDLKKDKNDLAAKTARLSQPAPADTVLAIQGEIAGLTKSIDEAEKQIKLYEQNKDFNKSLKYKSNYGMMHYVASVREPEMRTNTYAVVKTDGRGGFAEANPDTLNGDYKYYYPISDWFDWNKLITLIAVLIFGIAVVVFVNLAKKGKDLYLRPIAGLEEIENAVGRATEMGRPMLYCMGIGGLSDVATLASMGILGQVAKKAAEYDTKLIVPCYDYIVMPIAQEIVRESHYAVGRPDTYDKNNVFYLTSSQFAYVAGVNGIMIRERMATNFYMGYFAAEALLMTETGNAVGSVQIAGSDAITQIPFFITTCDYTLIGEELYAASAYLTREPMLLGTLKAQDYFKFLIMVFVIAGAILSTMQLTGLMQLFPLK